MGGNRRVAPAILRVVGAVAAVYGLGGCYTLQAIPGTSFPVLGSMIAVDITDAGRVSLGGEMGPGIAQVEGRLVRSDPVRYELAVTMVRYVRGGEQVWSGERVTVRREYVSRVYAKQISRSRTVATSVAAAGVIGYVAAKALVGVALGDRGQLPSDTAESVRRPVRP